MAKKAAPSSLIEDLAGPSEARKALEQVGDAATRAMAQVDALKAAFKGLSASGQAGPGGQRLQELIALKKEEVSVNVEELKRLKAVTDTEQSLRSQQDTIARLNAALDPAILRQRVELAREEEKARKELAKATQEERERQQPRSFLNKITFGTLGTPAGGEGAPATSALAGAPAGGNGASATGALAGIAPAALSAGAALLSFRSVALASPGTMERFNIAIEDTMAVVGQTLIPVVEMVTGVVRTVGDVLMTLMPPADSLREVLAPIADTFRNLAESLAPVLSIIQDVLVVALKALAEAVKIILYPFKLLADLLRSIFGGETRLKSSVGAATRNVSFTSQESALKQAYATAFRSGTGATGVERSNNLLANIDKNVAGIAGKLLGKASQGLENIGYQLGGEAAKDKVRKRISESDLKESKVDLADMVKQSAKRDLALGKTSGIQLDIYKKSGALGEDELKRLKELKLVTPAEHREAIEKGGGEDIGRRRQGRRVEKATDRGLDGWGAGGGGGRDF